MLDGTIIECYASNGFILDGIPFSAMGTESWSRQFFCYDNYLRFVHRRTVARVRVNLDKDDYAYLNRF